MQTRKEMVSGYLENGTQMGVYRLVNRENGKLLVGAAPNLEGIRNRHLFSLRMGVHTNKELQREWNHFGEEAFRFEIVDELKPREGEPPTKVSYSRELKELEALWIEELQPFGERGYHR